MSTDKISYGTYSTFPVSFLSSVTNDATDPFVAWQSGIIDNTSVLADDYEIHAHITMLATAPANDSAGYIYALAWVYDGSVWNYGGNYGTTTYPVSTQSSASLSDPNSMKGPIPLPYKVSSQTLDIYFTIAQLFGGVVPDAFSLAFRSATGAGVSSVGSVIGYRPITYTNS